MNIFKHELKQNQRVTAVWIVLFLIIAALYISIYPSFAGNMDISKLVKQFPQTFKKIFGVTDNFLATFPALYSMVLNFIILAGAVQAMNLGTKIISKEAGGKTADFLLSKPVKRHKILSQKLLSAAALLTATNIVFLTAAWSLIQFFVEKPFNIEVFIKSSLTLFFIQLFFLALGFLLGVALKRIKSVIALSLPTVFGFYVFGLLDTVIGKEKIKYLTPFKFFDLNKLTSGGTYQAATFIYLALLLFLFITASFFIYQKKDIHII